MVGAQAQDSATATGQLATEQAVQTTLPSKFSAQSGVSMDTEMSTMVAAAERLRRQRPGDLRGAGDVVAVPERGTVRPRR